MGKLIRLMVREEVPEEVTSELRGPGHNIWGKSVHPEGRAVAKS